MTINGTKVKTEYEQKAKMLLESGQTIHIDEKGNVYSNEELAHIVWTYLNSKPGAF